MAASGQERTSTQAGNISVHVLGRGTLDRPFRAYEGDEPYAFVCYSHDDQALVYPELTRLRDSGVHAWYDEGIGPGSEWSDSIAEHIEHCATFLYFVTPRSVETEHCRRELSFAIDQSRRVLAVHLVPTELPSGLKLTLSNRQAILKYDEPREVYEAKLARAIGDARSRDVSGTLTTDALHPRRSVEPSPRRSITSAIAVLPFTNMSNDPEQEYFSDGITEDILNELAKSADLVVRPRSSSFSLKGQVLDIPTIGKRLNVTHVLDGSVRRSGERVRVVAQLSDVKANTSVWSARYDRDLTDIFDVQDEITRKILEALNAHLANRRASRRFAGTEAYNAFLRGRNYLAQWDARLATEWFERATQLDPENADAWAGLARIVDMRGPRRGQSLADHREEIDTYFGRALAIEPTNPHALALKAQHAFFRRREYQSSIDRLVALANENPNHEEAHRALSFVLAAIGRIEPYLQVTRRVEDIAPLSREAMVNEILALLKIGRIEEVREALREFSRLQGREEPYTAAWLAVLDRDGAALEAIVRRNDDGWHLPYQRIWFEAMVPYLAGDFARARELVGRRFTSSRPLSVQENYLISLVQRDFDGALDQYAVALDLGLFFAFFEAQLNYHYRQAFPELYEHPRFNELLQTFKIDPASTATLRVPELHS